LVETNGKREPAAFVFSDCFLLCGFEFEFEFVMVGYGGLIRGGIQEFFILLFYTITDVLKVLFFTVRYYENHYILNVV
jgi:hypothetical protein